MNLVLHKLLITIAAAAFLLTLFSPQTIILAIILVFLLFTYIKSLFKSYNLKTIVAILPQPIKYQLINRSIFDILCDFWFMQWTTIFKVCLRPFIQHIQPHQAAGVLQQLPPHVKQKFLVKGIVQMLPQETKQKIFQQQKIQKTQLSSQKKQKIMMRQQSEEESQIQKPMINKINQKNQFSTDDTIIKKKSNIRKGSTIILKKKFVDQSSQNLDANSSSKDRQINIKRVQIRQVNNKQMPKWDRLQLYQGIQKRFGRNGLSGTIKSALEMTKKIVQLNQLSNKILKVKFTLIIKLSIIFWILLIAQIKMSPHARRLIFKTLYVLAGVLSILGVITTTGILIYKSKNYNEEKELKAPKNYPYQQKKFQLEQNMD